jgi:hypothetical protein
MFDYQKILLIFHGACIVAAAVFPRSEHPGGKFSQEGGKKVCVIIES